MEISERSFYEYLKAYAKTNGDKPLFLEEGRSFGVQKSLLIVNGLAEKFLKMGIKKGDFIAVRALRSIETAIFIIAIASVGGVAVLCDMHFTLNEFLAQNCPELSISAYITSENGAWTLNGEALAFDEVADITLPKQDAMAPAMVIFTSGSTGKSKGVVLSQYNTVNNSVDTLDIGYYFEDDINIDLVPLNHVFGIGLLVAALISKHSVFFAEDTSPKYILSAIERHKITRMNGVPTLFLAMAEELEKTHYDISSFRAALIGGGPYTKEQFLKIERALDIYLIPVYGMTECIGISCASYRQPQALRQTGAGMPYSFNEVTISPNGEILVKSPSVALGYLDGSSVTEEDGYLHTGDLGRIDENGILQIEGRLKDVIIRAGVNISSVKVEKAILSLPYVSLCAVVGVKDERYGEVVCSAVTLKEERTEEEIKQALLNYLPKHEIPQKILILSDMPLTFSGKVDKMAIKELFL